LRSRCCRAACTNAEGANVAYWQIVLSNSGTGCQALHDHPCRAHCSSAVGACPPHDGVRRRWRINVASAVAFSGVRKESGDLTTATVPGTSFPALSREHMVSLCSVRESLLLRPVELGSVH